MLPRIHLFNKHVIGTYCTSFLVSVLERKRIIGEQRRLRGQAERHPVGITQTHEKWDHDGDRWDGGRGVKADMVGGLARLSEEASAGLTSQQ